MRGLGPTVAATVMFASVAIALPLQAAANAPRAGLAAAREAVPIAPERAPERAFTRISARTTDPPASDRLAASTSGRATASRTVSATMGDFFYDPEVLTISPRDTVIWTNVGEAPEGHTVTGDGFDSGVVEEGGTFSHRFDEAGTFDYICSLHDNMTGTVVVRAASPGGGGGGTDGSGSGGGEAGSGGGGGEAGSGGGRTAEGGGATSSGSGGGSGSGSGGSSASAGGGSGSGSGGSATSGGGEGIDGLAYTGLNLILLFEIGVGLLAGGYLIRRLVLV